MELIFPPIIRAALESVLLRLNSCPKHADLTYLEKASIFKERFREIVSDPLNLLIDRVPQAGYIDQNGCVILHNGNRVPISGKYA